MKRRSILGCILVASLLAASLVGFSVKAKHNDLDKYAPLSLPAATSAPAPNAVHATFFGVSCILFDDGEHAVLVDGFFSRPGRAKVILGRIEPDVELIEKSLQRAGIKKLDAVLVTHSHYDHALDCAEIAKRTGAVVAGSESTANIARGAGLDASRIKVMKDKGRVQAGDFDITFIGSAHAPSAAMHVAGGEITKPLTPPAHALRYQEGGTYSLLIKHRDQSMLVQSSAGFVQGALKGQSASVVFLGVGLLGKQNAKYREQFWQEVVRAVGAKRLIPVHWDDFMKPLSEPLVFAPSPFDEVEEALDFIIADGKRDSVEVRFAPVWQRVDPFSGIR